jgi:hypothetical protein
VSLNATKDPTFSENGERRPHRNSRHPTPIPVPQGDVAVELSAGRYDIERWALWALGVNLNRGQRRFVRACAMRAANGYGPAFLDIAVSAGNRAGKTLVLAIVILPDESQRVNAFRITTVLARIQVNGVVTFDIRSHVSDA